MLHERRSDVMSENQRGGCGGCPAAGGQCATRCPLISGKVNSEGISLRDASPIIKAIKSLPGNVFGENHSIIFRRTGMEVVRPLPSECSNDPGTCQCEKHLNTAPVVSIR